MGAGSYLRFKLCKRGLQGQRLQGQRLPLSPSCTLSHALTMRCEILKQWYQLTLLLHVCVNCVFPPPSLKLLDAHTGRCGLLRCGKLTRHERTLYRERFKLWGCSTQVPRLMRQVCAPYKLKSGSISKGLD